MDLFKDPLYQSVDECTTEKVVRDITNGKELRRIDIWMNVSIAVGEEKLVVPVIVENKVYASENGDQTKAYHEAMDTFCQRKNLSGAKCLPIEIYLAPEGTAKPSAESRRRNRIQYG
ncbi:MAG: PD-(D/E)XK nuclease family protein [Bacteroidales bacterium]|nr:PD-(D/E)XK nuclease family protein [Candidatus Liminaster caballi]